MSVMTMEPASGVETPAPPVRPAAPETILKPNIPTSLTPAADHPLSIWLVEDNQKFSKTVARVISQAKGMDCSRLFSSAEDAIKALVAGGTPDVIFLDVNLPGQNGIAALPRIKAICPSTRVVMLTVFDDHDKVFRAVCAGASGYLLKDSPLEVIIEAIHQALQGGAPMSPPVAKAVLEMLTKTSRPRNDHDLTAREQEVLELMARGLTKKEISSQLSVSYHTVDAHVKNIYTKLHVHSFTEAVTWALKQGYSNAG